MLTFLHSSSLCLYSLPFLVWACGVGGLPLRRYSLHVRAVWVLISVSLCVARPYITTDHAGCSDVLCALSPLARLSSSITPAFDAGIQQRGAVTLPFRP